MTTPAVVYADKLDDIADTLIKHLGGLDEWRDDAMALGDIASYLRALAQPDTTTRKATTMGEPIIDTEAVEVIDQRHTYLFYGALLAEIAGLAAHLADLNSRQVRITNHGAHLDVLAQISNAVEGAEELIHSSRLADEAEAASL
ncbi:hypothetical protein [Mycobacteroides abscessus]|uniref:hypothetical protein n=1 Tax=Mycobacteroides abscessus TaxID=36809 RepID=UPI0010573499|nr:hypothetical protein [Mycobacteroides abscessus]MDO3023457.1 hypothetical protein [Mycobacteroides abscessus subsp. abscessus]